MKIYVNLDGELYAIEAYSHVKQRMSQRFAAHYMNSEFIVGRMQTLLENPQFVDVILNGVRYGEDFIVEDIDMGLDMAVSHVIDKECAHIVIKTVREYLRRSIGEKVIRVQTGNVHPYYFKREEAWSV